MREAERQSSGVAIPFVGMDDSIVPFGDFAI
jgi:hypothetical protein